MERREVLSQIYFAIITGEVSYQPIYNHFVKVIFSKERIRCCGNYCDNTFRYLNYGRSK